MCQTWWTMYGRKQLEQKKKWETLDGAMEKLINFATHTK